MPAVIVVLLLMGLFGGAQGPERTTASDNTNAVVSTQFGGVLAPESDSDGFNESEPIPIIVEETTEPEPEPALPPVVNTKAPQDLGFDRATMRGEIAFPGASFPGTVYFLSSADRDVVANQTDSARRTSVYFRPANSVSVNARLDRLRDNVRYYYQLCFETDDVAECGEIVSFETVEDIYSPYSFPRVSTGRVYDIQAEQMTVPGTFSMNDAEEVTLFFVYGENQTLINRVASEFETYRDVDEEGDDLQKVRVSRDDKRSGTVERVLDDLERGTTYYYRFCIAYDDDETGIRCGNTRSQKTRDRDLEIPTISDVAARVNDEAVRFSARLDMEDYRSGHGFLVYGSDESRVERVASLTRFRDVSQSGATLQRVSIDANLIGRDDVSETVEDIPVGDYWYRFCIEYVALNDSNRNQYFLECSDPDSFIVE